MDIKPAAGRRDYAKAKGYAYGGVVNWPSQQTAKVQGCNIASGYGTSGYSDTGESCTLGDKTGGVLERQRNAADETYRAQLDQQNTDRVTRAITRRAAQGQPVDAASVSNDLDSG